MIMTHDNNNHVSVKVWDLPIRVFHWLLAVLVAVMFVSAELENFDVHIFTGKTIAILLIIRLVWGFVGSSNARLSALLFRPREYIDYIATLPERKPGYGVKHSPVGALAVIVILLILVVQVSTGLVASDIDGLVEGPFAYYVSYDSSRWATDIHLTNKSLLLAMIGLHLAANAFYYFYKKDNLVHPMITGSRPVPQSVSSDKPEIAPLWKGAVTLLVTAAVMIWIFYQYG